MLHRLLLLPTAVAFILALTEVAASAQERALHGPFASNNWNVETSAELLNESWNLNSVRESLAGGAVSVGYSINDRWQVNTEVALLHITQKTGYSVLVPALSTIVRRLVYRRGGASVFAELGPGVSYATDEVPPRGTRFNYVVQAGVGMSYRMTAPFTLVSGLRWLHISNNGLAGPARNPDIQALGGYVGVAIG